MTRDEIRQRTLGRAHRVPSRLVDVDGVAIEVRRPSIRQRSQILRRGKALGGAQVALDRMDPGEFQVTGLIECCFVPGTDERVFSEADREALLGSPAGAYDGLTNALMELMSVDEEELAENFGATPCVAISSR